MDGNKHAGAFIERGSICEKKADAQAGYVYKVTSSTRDGIKSRWMEAVSACVSEYTGGPPQRDRFEYAVGDEVNYFMFADGRGMILGRIRREL